MVVCYSEDMYTIKLVQASDIEILADIFSKSFTQADAEKPWDKSHAEQYLLYWLAKQPDMFFAAFDEAGNPIGAMVVNIKPWRTSVRCSDGALFVSPEHQKQGIAKALFKRVIEEAVNKYNATSFEAVTFAAEEFPLTWYKKLGILPDEHAVLIKGDCSEILKNLSH